LTNSPAAFQRFMAHVAVERVVRSLKELLDATAVGGGLFWENHFIQIRMEHMQRIHSILGCSPNEVVSATRPHFPLQLMQPTGQSPISLSWWLSALLHRPRQSVTTAQR
jgi:hypothetical protein